MASEYQEIVEDLKHCHWEDYSELKFSLIKRDLKKTLDRIGYIDYSMFPPMFRWHLCASRLAQGKFNNWDGWEFRSNWSITFQGLNGFDLKVPKWDGKKVNKLVIASEQGIGDEILYASAIPELIVRLGHEALEMQCHPRLIPIIERSFRIRCVPRETLSNIQGDAVVALADLFMFYRKDESHFPKKPYLQPKRKEYWLGKLGQYPRPWVGIAWKSRHGSLRIKDLLPKEGTAFNVQYGEKDERLVEIQPDSLIDMDDHISFVSALDRVITVTQTVVHEAGAVGTECIAIKPPKGTGEVDCHLWYYGVGSPHPHLIYGNVTVFDSIDEFTKRYSV